MTVLVALTHALHVRNLQTSGALDAFEARGHRVIALTPDSYPPVTAYSGGRFRRWLRSGPLRTASYVTRARASETYRDKLKLRREGRSSRGRDGLLRRVRARLEIIAWRLIEQVGCAEATANWIEDQIPPCRRTLAMLVSLSPDVLLVPTFLQDGLEVELAKCARCLGIPVVAQLATYDAATAKGQWLYRPDYVLVWGQHAQENLVALHGFLPERVVVTGPPQFDCYAAR